MAIQVANNAASSLQTSIEVTSTYITVSPGEGGKFPHLDTGDVAYVTVFDIYGNMEIMKVTARNGDTMVVERAQEGTTAFAFAVGARVEGRFTAGMYNQALEAVNIVTDLEVDAVQLGAGESAYADYNATERSLTFGIPPGVKGDKGDAGTLEIGTVTTGAPGTDAVVENVGTTSSAILNITLPRSEGATFAFGRMRIQDADLVVDYYGDNVQDTMKINSNGEVVIVLED